MIMIVIMIRTGRNACPAGDQGSVKGYNNDIDNDNDNENDNDNDSVKSYDDHC